MGKYLHKIIINKNQRNHHSLISQTRETIKLRFQTKHPMSNKTKFPTNQALLPNLSY